MIKDGVFYLSKEEDVIKRVNDLKNRSSEIHARLAQPLKALWNPERALGKVHDLSAFNELYERFPNFREVIEFYESNAIALDQLGEPFEAIPVLLQGDPGLGKTYFVSELARLFALDFYEISMATVTASFAISGSNIQWGEGSTGFIANSLTSSSVGNPIILLDEIDKVSGSYNYNPISAFYSLLESHSATRFKDEALEIEMDISKVIWISTSNYLENIPSPIQSRMRVFNIERAPINSMPNIVRSIYKLVKNSKVYGKLIEDTLSESVINALVNLTPREIKQSIEIAIINAIKCKRSNIQLNDMPIISKKENYRVGFI